MARDQQQEIGQLRAMLSVWGLPPVPSGPADMQSDPMSSAFPDMRAAIDELRRSTAKDVGQRFLQLMIPHHQAGVTMASKILETTNDGVLRGLATSIARVQESEITLLQDMLRMRYRAPQSRVPTSSAPSAPPSHAATSH